MIHRTNIHSVVSRPDSPNSQTVSDVVSYKNTMSLFSDVKSGDKTPDYRKRVSEGSLLPVNHYTRDVTEGDGYLLLGGSGTSTQKWWPFPSTAVKVSDFVIVGAPKSVAAVKAMNPLIKDAIRQRARANLNNKVANVKVDLPTELGEAGETVRMLKNYIDSAVKYGKDFKRINSKWSRYATKIAKGIKTGDTSKRHLLKNVALEANNKYLEFQFGWKPLYGLCESSAELLRLQLNGEPTRMRIAGGNDETVTTVTKIREASFDGNSSCPTFSYDIIERWSCLCIVGGILLDEERWKRLTLSEELGLNASNIIPSLWELTTLSFIADYFVNIEGLLSNLKFGAQKMHSETLFESILIKYEQSFHFVGFTPRKSNGSFQYSNQMVSPQNDDPSYRVTCFSRSPTSATNLLVTPAIRVPTWDHIEKTLSVGMALLAGGRQYVSTFR